MVNKAKPFSVIMLVLIASAAAVQAQQQSFDSAQTAINDAYRAILGAHDAGVETNQLIEQLNQAINLTAKAQKFAVTSPQQAEMLASQAQAVAENVTRQALECTQPGASLPVFPIVAVSVLLAVGVTIYALGPKILWKMWFTLKKGYRVKTSGSKSGSSGAYVTPEQVCAVLLGLTVVVACVCVSAVVFPRVQGEQFSELGVLGPNMKLGDYPSQLVASETANLYVYVGNQMGKPMFYTVMIKLGNNNTQTNPANATVIQQYQQIVGSNQTWTFPVSITLTQPGLNQRLIFELWTYNETTNHNQYHQRWGQVWLNVTAPAS